MSLIEVIRKDTESKNGILRSKMFMILKCDQCGSVFEQSKNVKVISARPRHYCNTTCHSKAMESGGIADSSRKKTCRQKYGSDYLVTRSDIASAAGKKAGTPECRRRAKQTLTARMETYSYQLKRGLVLTRSKSEVDFLSAVAAELGQDLTYQAYKNGWWIDAYCPFYDCWIQFDGIYWHSQPVNKIRDEKQDNWFREQGLILLRITDKEARMPDAVNQFVDLIRASGTKSSVTSSDQSS